MKLLSFILFASCLVFSHCGFLSKKVDVRGAYYVAIRMKGFTNAACGGSVLNERWVLTSAECALRKDDEIVSSQTLGKKDSVFHFDRVESNGNLALIKTTEPMTSSNIRPAKLASPGTASKGTSGIVYKHDGDKYNLEHKEVQIGDHNQCSDNHRKISPDQLCVVTPNAKDHICREAMGGSLVVPNPSNAEEMQVLAVAIHPCVGGKGSFYEDVVKHQDWIKETISH